MQPIMVQSQIPKYKNNVVSVLLQVSLAIVFFAVSLLSASSFYGLIPYTQQGVDIMNMLSPTMLKVVVFGFVPLVMTGLFYLIWTLFYRFCLSSIFRTMQVLGQNYDINYARNLLSVIFIFGFAMLCLCNYIFLLFPLAAPIGLPLAKALIKISMIGLCIVALCKKQEAIYKPIIISGLLFPSLILIFLV